MSEPALGIEELSTWLASEACWVDTSAGSTAVVGPDLDAAAPSAALVEQRVRNGQGVMPAFAGTLSDEQIAAVAAYVSSVAGG